MDASFSLPKMAHYCNSTLLPTDDPMPPSPPRPKPNPNPNHPGTSGKTRDLFRCRGWFSEDSLCLSLQGVTSDLPVLTLLVPGRRIPVFPRSEGRLEKGPFGLRVIFMGQWLILLPSFCGPFKELNARVHVFRLVLFIFFSITV